MAWTIVAVGAVGLLIGIRYRVPALIAATLVTVMASAAGSWILGFPTLGAVSSTLYLVLVLQGAYLIGLSLGKLRQLL